ncbi:MAG: UDP-glucose/GDP-mannose dehydrogenase family protein [Actinobacteria bacterium]|nr:UDP-glucose/GDP-mannose dehydrogenase family protein [Actinomycetota bacterium]
MKVCVIGVGYVGLVTGVCLAEIGHNVICIDNIDGKIEKLKNGISPIYEPGLELFIKKNLKSGNISFINDIKSGVENSEIILISVGTPSLSNGQADLTYVENVAKEIGKYINNEKVIVNKSTVPIGSGDWVSKIISESIEKNNSNKNIKFSIVSNPEFLREGSALVDTFFPERIIIGSSSKKAIEKMLELYKPLIDQSFNWPSDIPRLFPERKNVPVVVSDLASAEMIKYASNSFLATKISFVNEVANICEKVGADIKKVTEGMGLDSRIGPKFLNAGIGWGGSCLPKDVSALAYTAKEYGYISEILNAVAAVNIKQRNKIVKRVQDELKIVKGKTIAVIGIAFKPDTDDVRESPSIYIMNSLIHLDASIKAYDPIVKKRPKSLNEKVTLCKDAYEAIKDADLLILATEWKEFKHLDYSKIKNLMAHNIIIDGRNLFDKEKLQSLGFKYIGIGR